VGGLGNPRRKKPAGLFRLSPGALESLVVLTFFLAELGLFLRLPSPLPSLREGAFFFVLALFFSRLEAPFPFGRLNMAFVIYLASTFLFPPQHAALLAFLGLWPSSSGLAKELLNRSRLGLATLGASLAYQGLGEGVIGALGSSIGYLAISLSAPLLQGLHRHSPLRPFLKNALHTFLLPLLGLAPLALAVAKLYKQPVLTGIGEGDASLLALAFLYVHRMWLYQERIAEMTRTLIESSVRYLEARDPYTALHSERVARIAEAVGREMGLSPEQLLLLRRGALLHDIGKLRIPDSILRKEKELAPNEWEVMRMHPIYGEEMVRPLKTILGQIGTVVRWHHERWAGGGYPDGLAGEEIPLLARIVAVADAYEALTSHRPYRQALSPEEAFARIRKESGVQFDPAVVEAFARAWRRGEAWREREKFHRETLV
jgi:putative nucleotidyltransferase with HDIG domain